MQTFTYQTPVKGAKLMDELLLAIPACRPIDLKPQMALEATATACRITVPDTVAKAEVDAVVTAHDPTTPSPSEAQEDTDDATLRSWPRPAQVQAHLDQITADLATLAGLAQSPQVQILTRTLQNQRFILRNLDVFVRHTAAGQPVLP